MHVDESHDPWTLSPAEHAAICAKSIRNRLSFASLLKYFGIYARFPRSLSELDHNAIAYLGTQLDVDDAIPDDPFSRTTRGQLEAS